MEMIAVDTNVIVRFLTKDDPAQYQIALDLINENVIFIPETVWLETEWVLRFAYGFDAIAVASAFRKLLGLPQVRVNSVSTIKNAIDWHSDGLDFADALHLACSQTTPKMATFDKVFAKRSMNLGSCAVVDLSRKQNDAKQP